MNILVLYGGSSDEREVSLRSGKNVADALTTAGHGVELIDTQNLSDNELLKHTKSCDVTFIALHGIGGEDGTLQAKLDSWGISYVGSDAESSKKCMSKQATRTLASENGIVIARGDLVDFQTFCKHPLAQKPYVLKPDMGGSSVDTFIVRDIEVADMSEIKKAIKRYETMILEELIDGTEITVGILGNDALPVIEIIPPNNEEFDYTNKYNGATQEICPPKNVSEAIQKNAQEIALKAHTVFGCRHMSRTDFMIKKSGELILIDINTIPGLTEQSLLPKAAFKAGYDMARLTDLLVKLAQS